MKGIPRRLTAAVLTVCIGFTMSGCNKYDEDDYIGKTSQEKPRSSESLTV